MNKHPLKKELQFKKITRIKKIKYRIYTSSPFFYGFK